MMLHCVATDGAWRTPNYRIFGIVFMRKTPHSPPILRRSPSEIFILSCLLRLCVMLMLAVAAKFSESRTEVK